VTWPPVSGCSSRAPVVSLSRITARKHHPWERIRDGSRSATMPASRRGGRGLSCCKRTNTGCQATRFAFGLQPAMGRCGLRRQVNRSGGDCGSAIGSVVYLIRRGSTIVATHPCFLRGWVPRFATKSRAVCNLASGQAISRIENSHRVPADHKTSRGDHRSQSR
jgi:hypothetical protein